MDKTCWTKPPQVTDDWVASSMGFVKILLKGEASRKEGLSNSGKEKAAVKPLILHLNVKLWIDFLILSAGYQLKINLWTHLSNRYLRTFIPDIPTHKAPSAKRL